MAPISIRSFVLGMLLWVMSTPIQAQFGPDHVVVSSPVTASMPIQVFAPVVVCYHGDPVSVIVSSSVSVAGNAVSLTVNTNWSGICFSAGDPAVKKAVSFTLPPLPVGTYTLTYQLYNFGRLTDEESVVFDVTSGFATPVPSLSLLSLVLLVLLVLAAAFRYAKRRVP